MPFHMPAALIRAIRNTPHKVAQVFFFGTGAAVYTAKRMAVRGWVLYNDVFIDITDVGR